MNSLPDGFEPADEVAVKTFTLYGCRCDEPVLDRLIATVGDGASPQSLILAATWEGVRLRRDSLPALRAAVEGRTGPGDPQTLTSLHIEGHGAGRVVTVELADTASITVASVDTAWALGKSEQLRRILVRAGGRPRPSLSRDAVIWIKGPVRRRGWRAWELGDRIAALALVVTAVAALLRVLTG
jgi:hypothetical protein